MTRHRLTLGVSLLVLLSCSSPKPQAPHHYTVKAESTRKVLNFNGFIQPLRENSITSPVDATIEKLRYHYGQRVKKAEVIAVLNSTELQKQYNDSLTEYLKAKDSYSIAQAKFRGTENLWEAGLISKNNFLSEKSSLDVAHVAFMQVSQRLKELLKKMDKTTESFSKLSIAEFEKVRKALTLDHQRITLKAPQSGILLYPPKLAEDKSHFTIGSMIKQGQVFAVIGDLTGLRIEINVPEVDIAKISPGMKATITGVALGEQRLIGELITINSQALNSGAGLPTFTAEIEVKKLSAKEQSQIKIGMSVSVELVIETQQQLVIPIAAVSQRGSKNTVKLLDSSGKLHQKEILTGLATTDKVVISKGLKAGDVIIYG